MWTFQFAIRIEGVQMCETYRVISNPPSNSTQAVIFGRERELRNSSVVAPVCPDVVGVGPDTTAPACCG